ncbi:MAG TPA: hypothetical protein VFF98_14855 [Novosphingobium sp.]|nr:hypothetical protein [Novosphingobium sp.]HZV11480.1 hypothetical protein [Novosphingobium sp.]
MFRIDASTAAAALPAPAAAGTPGYFTGGNAGTGVPPTTITADWLNLIQEELMAIVNFAGLAPSKTATNQVLQALQQNFSAPFQTVFAGVASNALTLGWTPAGPLWFRSATLTSGAPVAYSPSAPASLALTVPSGATLGTIAGQQATLALLVLYNGGAPVLAVVNIAGGVNLDETTLISSTAISSAATSAGTVYSAAAVAASPFRLVGYVQISEAVAGTWATAPALVQGRGGEAMAAWQSLGFGQTWQNVTASRVSGTTYYNTTQRPIFVQVVFPDTSGGSPNITITVGGVTLVNNLNYDYSSGTATAIPSFIVQPGQSYSVTISNGSIGQWNELR